MSTLQDLQGHGGRRRRDPATSKDVVAAVPLDSVGWAGTERPCPPRRGSFLVTDQPQPQPVPPTDDRRFLRVTIGVGVTIWVAAGSLVVLWIA